MPTQVIQGLTGTSHIVNPLLGYHLYAFAVRAVNAIGAGAPSVTSVTHRTLPVPPGAIRLETLCAPMRALLPTVLALAFAGDEEVHSRVVLVGADFQEVHYTGQVLSALRRISNLRLLPLLGATYSVGAFFLSHCRAGCAHDRQNM